MNSTIEMTTLPKTWIFDLDGTLVKHNGYLLDGTDTLLPGVKGYLDEIPGEDLVLILTARTNEVREETIFFLNQQKVRYDRILFEVPVGERIIVNDCKPSGAKMAMAFNLKRNSFYLPEVQRLK